MAGETLPNLDTFVRAAELASFTAAAHELGVSQAAVSQRIHTLESQLGVELFYREKSRVRLTEKGRTLHSYAQKILALHVEARSKVTGQPSEITGDLLLLSSSIPGEQILPEILAKFRLDYPGIQVRVVVGDSQSVLHRISQGDAQLGLVGMRADDNDLEYLPFAKDELVVIVSPDHAWNQKSSVGLDLLREQPLIVREAGSGSRRCLEAALAKVKTPLTGFHIAMEMDSNEAIKRSVAGGLGVSILSDLSVRNEQRTGLLHTLSVNGLSLTRDFFLVRDPRRVLPKPAELFMQALLPDQKE